jgi:hypothetical protein
MYIGIHIRIYMYICIDVQSGTLTNTDKTAAGRFDSSQTIEKCALEKQLNTIRKCFRIKPPKTKITGEMS